MARRDGCRAAASARRRHCSRARLPADAMPVGDWRVGCMGRRSPGRSGGPMALGRARTRALENRLTGHRTSRAPDACGLPAGARHACRRGWPKGALYTGRGPVCGTIIRGGGACGAAGALGLRLAWQPWQAAAAGGCRGRGGARSWCCGGAARLALRRLELPAAGAAGGAGGCGLRRQPERRSRKARPRSRSRDYKLRRSQPAEERAASELEALAAGGDGRDRGLGFDRRRCRRGGAGRRPRAACCLLMMAFRASPGLEMCERSILVLISSASARTGREDRLEVCAALAARKWRAPSPLHGLRENWNGVFFSVTPTSGSTSRIDLLLTSSSLARSLIRILLIRPFVLRTVPLSLHINLTASVLRLAQLLALARESSHAYSASPRKDQAPPRIPQLLRASAVFCDGRFRLRQLLRLRRFRRGFRFDRSFASALAADSSAAGFRGSRFAFRRRQRTASPPSRLAK